MRYRLLDLLECKCGRRFKLDVFSKSNKEVKEGLLRCRCGKFYPIVRAIPRIVPSAFEDNPAFVKKYSSRLEKLNLNREEIIKFKKRHKRTQETFGFQWKTWGKRKRIYGFTKEETKDFFFKNLTSKKITPRYFKGKLVLEGGCGHGLSVEILGELGADVVGLDISSSVEVAYERTRHLPSVNIVQGSINDLPFRNKSFDYVWSMGVIHHTPSSKQAFHELAKTVKSKGRLYVWVYPKGGFLWETCWRLVRAVTTRIPEPFLYYFSYTLVPGLYIIPAYNKNVNLSNMSWKDCALSIHDWLSPKYQHHHTSEEVVGWFKKEGFKDVEVLKHKVGVIGKKK